MTYNQEKIDETVLATLLVLTDKELKRAKEVFDGLFLESKKIGQ